MNFRLLEISTYGWNGISICTIETEEYVRSLFHVESTMNRRIVELFYFIKFVF